MLRELFTIFTTSYEIEIKKRNAAATILLGAKNVFQAAGEKGANKQTQGALFQILDMGAYLMHQHMVVTPDNRVAWKKEEPPAREHNALLAFMNQKFGPVPTYTFKISGPGFLGLESGKYRHISFTNASPEMHAAMATFMRERTEIAELMRAAHLRFEAPATP